MRMYLKNVCLYVNLVFYLADARLYLALQLHVLLLNAVDTTKTEAVTQNGESGSQT